MVVVKIRRTGEAPQIQGVAYLTEDVPKNTPGVVEGVFCTGNGIQLIVTSEQTPDSCYLIEMDRAEWTKLKEAL